MAWKLHTSLLLITFGRLVHMATLSCKGSWEMLPWAALPLVVCPDKIWWGCIAAI